MADHKENKDQTTSQSSDNYEGWGFDLFPERRGTYKPTLKNVLFQGRGNENLERIKCERKVASCLSKSPLVKIMMGALRRSGCEVNPSRHIACELCDSSVHGGYDPIMNQVVICQNTATSKGTIQGVLTHELIHMFDNCTRKLDFRNIEHLACTEIRAANLTHCGLVSSILEGHSSIFNFRKKHQDCVKHKATVSVLAVRNVTYEQAKGAVEKVFDRCYADLEPIGRRIRGKSVDFELAYAEAFLMGYD
ncbi:mitochondrial inner membrane protease ATP23 homolog [Rhopalosiphum maidis]|uniref:mitochondrial inner membrane protease ATP23 homolog n=1 Tax=Rhopalosiphum maidis TaxID=43146 RepID=UPI000F00115E|nr:mitochondrial inner membrane protease ATP23 homolog [Rhopalosiphum maidis]XP_026809298.1 mitochondrial inner membrane protease ATP23 homolog [Rhopalosiphum maidis]